MEDLMERACQAFKEMYKISPVDAGFCFIEKFSEGGRRVVLFAKNKKAISAYKEREKVKRNNGYLILASMAGLIIIWIIFLWLNGMQMTMGKLFFLLLTAIYLAFLVFFLNRQDNIQEELKQECKGLIVYSDELKQILNK